MAADLLVHRQVYEFVEGVVVDYQLNRSDYQVLEVGSLDVNGSIRNLLNQTNYIGLDLVAGPGVDLVGDIVTSHLPDQSFDLVLCLEVLEHAPQAEQIVHTIHRVLKPEGLLILTCAATLRSPHSAYGGKLRPGEFYKNVDYEELESWCSRFELLHYVYEPGHKDLHLLARRR